MAKKKIKNTKSEVVPKGTPLKNAKEVVKIAVITDVRDFVVMTPFGKPSDTITIGTIEGVRCAFLPRHARGHRILPSEINSRANIYALKSLGVEQILSVSACGSLKEEIKPKDFVIPDQIFDRTKLREQTFFGGGIVAHVGIADPFCGELREILRKSAADLGINCHFGGTYVCIEGPQFSTKAESEVNRQHGFSIVGMTAVPEARLAREAEICYATIGLVTDYDVWKEGEEVSVDTVVANMHANVSNIKKLIKFVIPKFALRKKGCSCEKALQYAVMSKIDEKNARQRKKLGLLLGKYMK
jgi:5'-methylthioadenosine phosphorylase